MHVRVSAVLFTSLVLVSSLLSGCSTDFGPSRDLAQATSSVGEFQGMVHGGRQAVVGAHVFVLEVSTSGYGGRGIAAGPTNLSKSLLVTSSGTHPTTLDNTIGSPTNGYYYVTSGNFGNFSVGGDYTCDVGAEVYLYANGGNPGLTTGTDNKAISFLAALGVCPAGGNLAATVPFVYLSEVTTVAAAYALGGYATDALHIGRSNTTLAATGMNNAFATVGNLANVADGTAYATVPNNVNGGVGTAPQKVVNSIANILAACINTTAGSSSQCTTLFGNTKSGGGTTGTAATETATAAINLAHYPGGSSSASVLALYGLQPGVGAPYVPNLTSTPTDLSLQISYTGGGLIKSYNNPQGMVVDSQGNIFSANSAGAIVDTTGTSFSEFSNLGHPVTSAAISPAPSGTALNGPQGMALSADSMHLWITDYYNDRMVDYSVSAQTSLAHSLTSGDGPIAVAFDSTGNIWEVNLPRDGNGGGTLKKLNNGGTVTGTYSGNGINSPVALAIGPTTSGKIWIASIGSQTGSGYASVFNQSGAAVLNTASTFHPNQASTVAMDSSANAWFYSTSDTLLHTALRYDASASGTESDYAVPSAGASYDCDGAAVDGAGNSWIAGENLNNGTAASNRIFGLSNGGVSLTGSSFGLAPYPNNTTQPNAVVVDGSGNVWYSSLSDATLHEIVGVAAPVVTPVAAGVAGYNGAGFTTRP